MRGGAPAERVRSPKVGMWHMMRRRSTRSTCSISPTVRSTWPTHDGRPARSPGTGGAWWRWAGSGRARQAISLPGRCSSSSNGSPGRPSRATVRTPRWPTCTRTGNVARRRTCGTFSTGSTTCGRSFAREPDRRNTHSRREEGRAAPGPARGFGHAHVASRQPRTHRAEAEADRRACHGQQLSLRLGGACASVPAQGQAQGTRPGGRLARSDTGCRERVRQPGEKGAGLHLGAPGAGRQEGSTKYRVRRTRHRPSARRADRPCCGRRRAAHRPGAMTSRATRTSQRPPRRRSPSARTP